MSNFNTVDEKKDDNEEKETRKDLLYGKFESAI